MTIHPVALRWCVRLLAVGAATLLLTLVMAWFSTPVKAQELPDGIEPAPEVAELPDGVVMTEWGPLHPMDRDFVVRVRYANMWEAPAGQMAMDKGNSEFVREIGQTIRDQHIALDEATREVAEKLGIQLPDEIHPANQLLLNDMTAAEGEEFDRRFAQHLREAHGIIYPIIAYSRAGTQNELIREFAVAGEAIVEGHLRFTEDTGLVDWELIPPPPQPLGTQSRFLGTEPAGVHPMLIWVVLLVGAIGGGVQMVRTIRPQ